MANNDRMMSCKYCGSSNVRKYGTYKDKQYYYCNDNVEQIEHLLCLVYRG